MFFLVCKLYKLDFYITTYLGDGQCFIWVFSIGIHRKCKTKHYLFILFFQIWKWYKSVNKKFILKVLDNIYIDTFQLVAFAKYILSQIYNHCIQNCSFWYFMEIVETFVFWRTYFQSLLIFMFFFIPKPLSSITQEWLVVESCVTPQWTTYLMFYRLVCNIHSHLNELILAWSVLL